MPQAVDILSQSYLTKQRQLRVKMENSSREEPKRNAILVDSVITLTQ